MNIESDADGPESLIEAFLEKDLVGDILQIAGSKPIAGNTQVSWLRLGVKGDIPVLPTRHSGGIDSIAGIGIESARALANSVRFGAATERRDANIAISEMIHALTDPYSGRIVSQPKSFEVVTQIEESLRRSAAKCLEFAGVIGS